MTAQLNMHKIIFKNGFEIELIKDNVSIEYRPQYKIIGSASLSQLPLSFDNIYQSIKVYHHLRSYLGAIIGEKANIDTKYLISKNKKYLLLKTVEVVDGKEIIEFINIKKAKQYLNKK